MQQKPILATPSRSPQLAYVGQCQVFEQELHRANRTVASYEPIYDAKGLGNFGRRTCEFNDDEVRTNIYMYISAAKSYI